MRNLLKKGTIPEVLTLGGIAFCKPKHKNTGCFYEEGFVSLRGSFHLAKWKNQGTQGV